MPLQSRLFATSLLLLTVLVHTACDPEEEPNPDPTPATLTSVSVTPASFTLAIGATQQLAVTGTYSDGTTKSVTSSATFVSDTPANATVSNSGGLVTAVAAGTAKVTATVSGKSATATVTVSAAEATLSSIALGPTPASVAQGATLQLTVTGTFSDGSTRAVTSNVTFSSSATGTATVSASGVVTGVQAGSATITATAGGKNATLNVTVTSVAVQPDANQIVFYDSNGTDVTFRDFGGSANNVTVDATETFNGRKVINFQVTSTGGYSGGAWVTTTPRDLSAYNALTFWAKASKAETLNVSGFGNDAGSGVGTGYPTERAAIALTTTWQKFTIPVANPARFKNVAGLFHIADAPDGYTLYLADVLYEHLGAEALVKGTASIANGTAATAVSLATAGTFTVDQGQNQAVFTIPGDSGSPVTLKPVANAFFDFSSSNTAVATVNDSGVITGVSAGGPVTVSATLGGAEVTGSYAVSVTGILGEPTTLPPVPGLAPGAAVYSLYSSVTGGYTGTASDKSAKVDTWRTDWSAGTGGTPFAITVGANSAAPRKYAFTSGANYIGIEFIGAAGVNQIDAAGLGLTTLRVDVWTPDNASNFQVKLVDFGANGAYGGGDDTEGVATMTATSTPPLATGAWLTYELSLASDFQGLAGLHHLSQMLLIAPNGGTMFVDNIYFHQ
ncbi:Ig-like domain-containing protein [Pyxidicoccus sp. MSG2]|uniref:Ig-like domain-containing protein n=1 Tax=Pyxidicoccus sp. MSG2 TaxID=2996790 RepID=UPI002271CB0B|nr:Ig-like domain-containing protein [Pyxidicoccus sp. MSG2]MCY1023440.1 Ig-like domain-containing protein [Pyxidicoccus sp. MSG2]